MNYKIMSHLVAGYPDYESSLRIAEALIAGGTAYLEIQFPFSDGTADGPLIQTACTASLEAGFTVKQGFELIRQIRQVSPVPVFIMTYANIAFVNGIRNFLEKAKSAGADGIIIPDLPPDSDENLFALGSALGLHIVPVIAPSISDKRLELIHAKKITYLYAALRKGITGKKTDIGAENIAFIRCISAENIKVLAGFGITDHEQVVQLSRQVHAAVIGSEFLRIIRSAGKDKEMLYKAVLDKIKNLVYG